jgi:hypothetical protein
MNVLTEIEELRGLRSNIRRGVNALEVCWSCEAVCEGTAWKSAGGRTLWLCRGCYADQSERRRTRAEQALRAGAN